MPFLLAVAAFAFFLWSLVIGFHRPAGTDPAPWLPDAGEPTVFETVPAERFDEAFVGPSTSRASRATPRPPAGHPPPAGTPATIDAPQPTGDGSAGRAAAPAAPAPTVTTLPTICPPPLPPPPVPKGPRPPRSKQPRAPKITIGSVPASPAASP